MCILRMSISYEIKIFSPNKKAVLSICMRAVFCLYLARVSNKKKPIIKTNFHQRNKHREGYDFELLSKAYSGLTPFVRPNKYGNLSIDYSDPKGVKALNTALLAAHYDIQEWDIPEGYLCPAIPGRADYLHYIADLLGYVNTKGIPRGPGIKAIDIGSGASCVYALVGARSYKWSFVATDIDKKAIQNIDRIIEANPSLKEQLQSRLQTNPKKIFKGVILKDEYFDVTICNPPYYTSAEEAKASTTRKFNNLHKGKGGPVVSNFGGNNKELWCEGGELFFILNMIKESKSVAKQCLLFSTLVSNKDNLDHLLDELKRANSTQHQIVKMAHGNKRSRILSWTFLNDKEIKAWTGYRWNQ